jgi:hypothetical protein
MSSNILSGPRRTLGHMKSRFIPAVAALKLRHQVAFSVLDPQVEIVKKSPTVKIVAGTVLTAAILSGNWGLAAGLAGCWIGTRPVTHVVASGVACVGAVDAQLMGAIARLQKVQAQPTEVPSTL